ncbi:MAG: TMEM175 family protein [Streptococcaceae bacterium]|jgi:uncharacterized membrane protein|nr:TMEM175 family protein [Streptococcaceae bacterium]
MTKNRLEAFTDAVLAIIMTILVLELPEPDSGNFAALFERKEKLLIYVFSFIILIIYWNNHHHLFQLVRRVDTKVLWFNNIFIFFLSLFPFSASWLGNYLFDCAPQAMYAIIIFLADLAYCLMVQAILKVHQDDKKIQRTLSDYQKIKWTLGLNILAIITSFIVPIFSLAFNLLMILLWIIPNQQIEKSLNTKK